MAAATWLEAPGAEEPYLCPALSGSHCVELRRVAQDVPDQSIQAKQGAGAVGRRTGKMGKELDTHRFQIRDPFEHLRRQLDASHFYVQTRGLFDFCASPFLAVEVHRQAPVPCVHVLITPHCTEGSVCTE